MPKGTAMPTRNVVLTGHHEAVFDWLVKFGRHQNASEVLCQGPRLIEQRAAIDAAKLDALREAARVGFRDLDEGHFVSLTSDTLGKFVGSMGREAEARVRKADQ